MPADARQVVIVEDEDGIRESVTFALTRDGHTAIGHGDGRLAWSAFAERLPDLVILDIGLPGMDGLELAERLRADPSLSGVKLIAMTGFGDASTRHRIEKAGFDRLLLKPVEFAALNRCLSRLSAQPPLRLSP